MRVTVCGIGTIGANLVEHLARQAQPGDVLRVIDFDKVEAANLLNQPWQRHQIGHPKTRALDELVARFSGASVETMQKRLTSENAARLLGESDIVIDAFDNREARAAVSEACRAAALPCIHAGLHPSGYAEVVWDERYTAPEADGTDACALRQARSLSLLAVAAVARVIERWRSDGTKISYTITSGDLQISPL